MKMSLLLAVAVVSVFHGAVMADDKLVKEKQCMGCHAIDKDGAAPSFQKIARLWKGRADAEPMLVATILQGSSSSGGPHWNKATMPDQAERPLVSDAEAKSMAKWILKQ